MKLAAVDIGSNAIRFQITNILKYNGKVNFKKLEYVRFPLRLGQDVFRINEISKEKEEKFLKLMHTFKMLIDLYEVQDYVICGTSAMREAKNGRALVEKAEKDFGIKIDIIDGDKEAELINTVLLNELDDKNYIHIDVGGGSTELNIYINKQKIDSYSFRIGSVRRLGGADSPDEWKKMEDWVMTNIKDKHENLTAIGTGGNIGKIFELAEQSRSRTSAGRITRQKIEEVQSMVSMMTLEERMYVLMLNPDRADVIVPASEIYLSVMKWAGAKEMIVPELGLKDGLIQMLYRKHFNNIEEVGFVNRYQK